MKLNALVFTLALSLVASFSASGAITFSGTYSSNLKQSDGTTNIAAGARYIMVVDTGNNGFGGAVNGSIADGTSLAPGQLFGGDEIVQSGTAPLTGRATADGVTNLPLDSAPYAGKQFAIYWFESLTGSTASTGDDYGFYRHSGWVIPAAPGTYNFTTTPSGTDFTQNTTAQTASLTVGAVPEPSRAILLGFGALGFMMRRRRK